MKPLNMAGAHGAWQMNAEIRKPLDIPAAARQLAAQGLKPHDISESLRIGVTAVEQALREGVA